jgi:hypothetical protein
MKKWVLMGVASAALIVAQPAMARLQLSITANGATFSCFDGQLSCDQSGGANNLLTVDTTVGGAFVELTLAQSTFGTPDVLQLSSSNIINETGAPITIGLVAGDNNFVGPATFVESSGSLTFNSAVGSGPSNLSFFADATNTQGANPLNTPGTLLESVDGTPVTNPDSFAGTRFTAFGSSGPFSMTESARLNLVSGGSITGFNQSMTTGVPEPSTWAMFAFGFGFVACVGAYRKRNQRLAF